MGNQPKSDYYNNVEYKSNSMLGWLKRSPVYFKACVEKKFEQKETTSLERGTLLHTYILEPEKFIVADIEPVGGMMGEFIRHLAAGVPSAEAHQKVGFKYSLAKVIENLEKPENQTYYNFLLEATDKLVISKNDKYIIERCKESIVNNKTASNLLFHTEGDVEIYNEYEIFEDDFIVKGFKAKAKLDRVIVNRKEGWAIISDLKTTSKTCYGELRRLHDTGVPSIDYYATGFMSSYIGYNYYRQQAYYAALALKHFGVESVTSFVIPVETNGMFECAVYKQSREFGMMGLNEIKSLISRYMWHEKTDIWTLPMELSKANTGYGII